MPRRSWKNEMADGKTYPLVEIEDKLSGTLSPSRFRHTQGVRFTAAALAMAHDADIKKAELAGLLHDCAKHLSADEMMDICRRERMSIRKVEENNPGLLHAKVGAYLARHDYGVCDEEILSAIRDHTTGSPGMPPLSQIVFLADFIEPGRTMCSRLPEIRKMAFEDLNLACYTVLKETQRFLQMQQRPVDERSYESFVYYERLLSKDA